MATKYRFLTSNRTKKLYMLCVLDARPTQPALLDSAIASPINHNQYGEEDLFRLAAILSERIIRNHAWQDGNKRAALVAADVFLRSNGYILERGRTSVGGDALSIADAQVKVADGSWSAAELARYWKSVAVPIARPDHAVVPSH